MGFDVDNISEPLIFDFFVASVSTGKVAEDMVWFNVIHLFVKAWIKLWVQYFTDTHCPLGDTVILLLT